MSKMKIDVKILDTRLEGEQLPSITWADANSNHPVEDMGVIGPAAN